MYIYQVRKRTTGKIVNNKCKTFRIALILAYQDYTSRLFDCPVSIKYPNGKEILPKDFREFFWKYGINDLVLEVGTIGNIKLCPACNRIYSFDKFDSQGRYCKPCRTKYSLKWQQKNKIKANMYKRRWENNNEKIQSTVRREAVPVD